jgi:hypothetical protein
MYIEKARRHNLATRIDFPFGFANTVTHGGYPITVHCNITGVLRRSGTVHYCAAANYKIV